MVHVVWIKTSAQSGCNKRCHVVVFAKHRRSISVVPFRSASGWDSDGLTPLSSQLLVRRSQTDWDECDTWPAETERTFIDFPRNQNPFDSLKQENKSHNRWPVIFILSLQAGFWLQVQVSHFNQYGTEAAWWQEMVIAGMSPLRLRLRFRFMCHCVYLDSFIRVFAARWLPRTHVVRLLSGTVVCKKFSRLSFPKPKLSGLKNYPKEIAKRLSHGPVCLCGSEESVS